MPTESGLDLLSKGSVLLPADALLGLAGDPLLKLGAAAEGPARLDFPVSCLLFLCFLFSARGNGVTSDDDLRPVQVPRRVNHERNTTSHSDDLRTVQVPRRVNHERNTTSHSDDLRTVQVLRRVNHERNTSHSSASASVSQPISHSPSVTVSAVAAFSGTRLDPNLNK
jgi:hypothetical protein